MELSAFSLSASDQRGAAWHTNTHIVKENGRIPFPDAEVRKTL